MTATTEFLAFATGVGANVLDQADYAVLTSTAEGYASGIANSAQFNKTMRQGAFMAAVIGNFLVGQGISQPDDGNLSAAVANLNSAIKQLVGSPNVFTGATTTGSANAQVLASVVPSTGFALNNGYTVIATAGISNTGNTTMNVASTGVKTVQKLSGTSLVNLTGGELVNGVNFSITWNSTAGVWVLQTTPPLGACAYLNIGAGLANDGSGNLAVTNGVPTGAALDFTGSVGTPPTGYLVCYGQAVSRSTYAALFNLYNAASLPYGSGDGSTTFNLPDCRGKVVAGVDNMGGVAANIITTGISGINGVVLGANGGNQQLHGHTHIASVTDPGHSHIIQVGGDGFASGTIQRSANTFQPTPTLSATTGISVSNASTGGGSSQNVQPTIMFNKIVKT
jgi:microcystin-dependent protein